MCLTEFDETKWGELMKEEGRQEGFKEGTSNTVLDFARKGKITLEDASEALDLDIEATARLLKEASQNENDEVIDMCVATQALIDKGISQGMSQGISQGENRMAALLKKIQSNPKEISRIANADEKERQEMYRQYGIID